MDVGIDVDDLSVFSCSHIMGLSDSTLLSSPTLAQHGYRPSLQVGERDFSVLTHNRLPPTRPLTRRFHPKHTQDGRILAIDRGLCATLLYKDFRSTTLRTATPVQPIGYIVVLRTCKVERRWELTITCIFLYTVIHLFASLIPRFS